MTPIVVLGFGFVGSAIVRRLARDHGVVHSWGDLDDLDGLVTHLWDLSPLAIVLAAGPPRHAGFRLDRKALNDHVMLAERVATYARDRETRIVLVSSTLALSPMRTGYGALKRLVEECVAGPRTVILRAGTVVGGLDDRNQSVLHRFVRAAAAGLPLLISDEAVGQIVFLVTRDSLVDCVAHSLSMTLPVAPRDVASWSGSVRDLADLVLARARRLRTEEVEGVEMISMIDTMLAQAQKEGV